MRRPWTEADDEELKRLFPITTFAVLIGLLNRSRFAIKNRVWKLGLKKPSHWWTPAQIAQIRELWPTCSAPEIARRIGRSFTSVYQRARILGLVRKRPLPHDAATIETVRQLHAQGLSDTQIAESCKELLPARPIDRRTVCGIRRRLKLPINQKALDQARRRAIDGQRKTLGVESAGQLRALAFRKYAVENGWPRYLRPREVQILNVLAEHGPKTCLELAELIGMRTDRWGQNGKQMLLCGNGKGGTYTASLVHHGLIFRQVRFTTGRPQGKNRLPNLYYLTPKAIAWREKHVHRQRKA